MLQERIAQWRKMTTDDPDNEVGHLSLGKILIEAGQYEEAVGPLRRALEISPQLSKANQLLGTALLKVNRRDEAIGVLKQGLASADQLGHFQVREDIARLLGELGEAVPAARKAAGPATRPAAPAAGGFACKRADCRAGAYARQLPAPPMSDDIGRRIYSEICADCWNDWLRNYSIKVINELRLDLSTERGQEVYDQIMREFFGFE
jgi:Fe-S cluster biosynthesis and repair protein YggX